MIWFTEYDNWELFLFVFTSALEMSAGSLTHSTLNPSFSIAFTKDLTFPAT